MIHVNIQDPATLSLQEAIEAHTWTEGITPNLQEVEGD